MGTDPKQAWAPCQAVGPCAALHCSPGPAETRPQRRVPLGPGTRHRRWWHLSPLPTPRGLSTDVAPQDMSWAALLVPSARQWSWPNTSFALTLAPRHFHAESFTCVKLSHCPCSRHPSGAWPQPLQSTLLCHKPQRTQDSLSSEPCVPIAPCRAPWGCSTRHPPMAAAATTFPACHGSRQLLIARS